MEYNPANSHSGLVMPQPSSRYHHGNLRSALLDAAEQELNEKGIEGISMRSVAKRAGVSHAAPAHHFGDARGVLTALAAIGFERLVEHQKKQESRAEQDQMSLLIAQGMGYIEFATNHPNLFRLMFSSDKPLATDEVLASRGGLAFNRLVEKLNLTMDELCDQKAMSKLLRAWGLVHGLSELLIAGRPKLLDGFSVTEQAQVLKDTLADAFEGGI